MSEELIELQTQLAFQEHTIAELNDVVTAQQKQLDLLRLELKMLRDKLGDIELRVETGPQGQEKPPHY
jgi:SlyX protein